MSIYHLHCSIIGRGNGQSAVAAAAYRSTTKLTDKETGIVADYTRKDQALNGFVFAPDGSPTWATDRAELWNAVQEKENRKNSNFAWSYDVAVPTEIADDEAMIRAFVKKNFVDKGLIVDANKHAPHKGGDARNTHWHITVTTRIMTPEGWGEKYRVGENKFKDRQGWLNEIRQSWQDVCNEELQRIGSKERIDCRTLEAQGIDRSATQHQGPTATKIVRSGKTPRRGKEKKIEPKFIDTIPEGENYAAYFNDFWTQERDWDLKKAHAKALYLQDPKKTENFFEQQEAISKAIATREHLPQIEKANRAETERNQTQQAEMWKTMPAAIAPKPNALKEKLMKWECSDGTVGKNYEEYAKHQQGLISTWQEKQKPLEDRDTKLLNEQNLIEKCKDDRTDKRPEALNRLLKLYAGQQFPRQKLFENIKTKAADLLKNSLEFSGYKNLKEWVSEVKTELAAGIRRGRGQAGPKQGHHR